MHGVLPHLVGTVGPLPAWGPHPCGEPFRSLETQLWCHTSSREPSLTTQAVHLLLCSFCPQTPGTPITCYSNCQLALGALGSWSRCVLNASTAHTHRGSFSKNTCTQRHLRCWVTHPMKPLCLFLYFWWKTPKSPWQASQFSQLTRQKISCKAAYLHKLLNKH